MSKYFGRKQYGTSVYGYKSVNPDELAVMLQVRSPIRERVLPRADLDLELRRSHNMRFSPGSGMT